MRGVAYSEEAGRYTQVQRRLGSAEVCNYARFGATAERTLCDMERHRADMGKGDTVVLGFGGNDCDYDWQQISSDPGGSFAPRTSAQRFVDVYRRCIAMARSTGARVFAAAIVPIDAQRYFGWITRGKNAANILGWLGDVSMLYRWQESYNELVCRTARGCGVPLVDLRTPFLLSHSFGKLLCCDGIHPTPEGHAMIDAALAGAVL